MSKKTNEASVGVVTLGLLAWVGTFFGIYEIIGPKEGFDVGQLITFYLAYKGANYVANQVLNFDQGGSK